MIYEKNNVYYLKQNDKYFVAEIAIKKHTISVYPTSEYVLKLDNPNIYTYDEVKNKYIKGVDKSWKN